MSKKVEYAFKVDGFYSSANYYRSDTPMNPLSMPAPTVTGITGLSYTDTTIQEKMNYVRFSTIRNGIEKISAEIKVDLSPYKKIYYIGNMPNPLRVPIYRDIVESLGIEMVDIAWSAVTTIPSDCKLVIIPDMSVNDGYFQETYLQKIRTIFSSGIPILISVYSGSIGVQPTIFPNDLGLATSFSDISATNSIDILANTVLQSPYDAAQSNLIIRESSYYMSGLTGVTANAQIFAKKGTTCSGAILLKGAINNKGIASPANVAFVGFAHTKPTGQLLNAVGKDLLKQLIQRIMR